MNDDIKSKLKEKLGAVVSDDELDKVAGGTMDQNAELLSALAQIDPQGVSNIIKKASGEYSEEDARRTIGAGVSYLLDNTYMYWALSVIM